MMDKVQRKLHFFTFIFHFRFSTFYFYGSAVKAAV